MNKFSWLCIGIAVIFVTVTMFSTYYSELLPIPHLEHHANFRKCTPNSNSPILLNLKTRMQVYYDGGQWFHMTENFLVQHSLLAEQQRQLQGKSIWYNFDKRKCASISLLFLEFDKNFCYSFVAFAQVILLEI